MIADRTAAIVALVAVFLMAIAPAAFSQGQAKPKTGRDIGVGETLRGELAAGDQSTDDGSYYDVFTFQATAGQSYIVTLDSDQFDAYLRVDGPGGLSAENDDASDSVTGSRVEFTAPASGQIEIEATSLARKQTGGYSISLQPGVANRRIALDQQVDGELSAASPKHTDGTPYQGFIFDGQAGQRITIDMASKDFDAFLVLRKAGSDEDLVSDDDGGGGTDAQIFFTLPTAGAYEIRANSISTVARGRFTLKLTSGVAERKPVVQPITYGRVIRGELKTESGRDPSGLFYDVYSFTGQKGDKVTITAVSGDFDPVLFLGLAARAREDDWLDSNDDAVEGSTDAQIQVVLPTDGAYELHVVSYNPGEAGKYTLGLGVDR